MDGERTKLAGATLPEGLTADVAEAARRTVDEAFVDAFSALMYIATAVIDRMPEREAT